MWSPIVAVSHAVPYSPIASIMSRSVSCCLVTMMTISHAVTYSPIGSIMSRRVSCSLIISHDVSYCLIVSDVSCCIIQSLRIQNVSYCLMLSHNCLLLSSALSCPSFPVSFIYRVSSNLVYTPCGFNRLRGHNYKKTYYPEDLFCANIIRDIRISCVSSSDFEYVISVISSH